MSNPETLRMVRFPFARLPMTSTAGADSCKIMQMQGQMGGPGGAGGMGGMFGGGGAGGGGNDFANLFAQNAAAGGGDGGAATANPTNGGTTPSAGGAGAGTGQQPANPFAAMMGGAGAGGLGGLGGAGGAGAGAGGGAGGFPAGFNPFMFGAPGAGGGGFGTPPPPQDSRPAEEIYATQLGQLNGMVSRRMAVCIEILVAGLTRYRDCGMRQRTSGH